jgi:hypothetical protein
MVVTSRKAAVGYKTYPDEALSEKGAEMQERNRPCIDVDRLIEDHASR